MSKKKLRNNELFNPTSSLESGSFWRYKAIYKQELGRKILSLLFCSILGMAFFGSNNSWIIFLCNNSWIVSVPLNKIA